MQKEADVFGLLNKKTINKITMPEVKELQMGKQLEVPQLLRRAPARKRRRPPRARRRCFARLSGGICAAAAKRAVPDTMLRRALSG